MRVKNLSQTKKRTNRRFVSGALLLLSLFGGSTALAEEDSWTVLVYMCGSNLESEFGSASVDLYEMSQAQFGEDVNVLVEIGGATEWQISGIEEGLHYRFQVLSGKDDLVDLEAFEDRNMGDPATLADFVSWGVENYPAEHTAVILWDHGGGSIGGICVDDLNNQDTLSLEELNQAFQSVCENSDTHFEFIGFDACLMSTLETANIISPYARYMFASEETEPGEGWDYTALLSAIGENPSVSGADLGEAQCTSYYQSCAEAESEINCTFAITDLEKISEFVEAFDQTALDLLENDAIYEIARSARSADNFGGNFGRGNYTNMVDLADFLRGMENYSPHAKEALEKLQEAVIWTIAGEQHESAGGLSFYYPLYPNGSQEMSVFRNICTSEAYLTLTYRLAYEAMASILVGYQDPDGRKIYSAECPLLPDYLSIGFDDHGTYGIEFADMSKIHHASCSLYRKYYFDDSKEECVHVLIGEDDNVVIDEDNKTIYDRFDGTWLYLNDTLLPIQLVDKFNNKSQYTCSVYKNGEETNLMIYYDWEEKAFYVPGTWEGIDQETGMSARDTEPLCNGDELQIIYYYMDEEGNWDQYVSDAFTVDGDLQLHYEKLDTNEYEYAINVYDLFGGAWSTDFVLFTLKDDGNINFELIE